MGKGDASSRIKRRYLLIEGRREKVEEALQHALGTMGTARAAPLFVEMRRRQPHREGTVVLAIDRKEIENIRAALELAQQPLRALRVSGTLKGLGKQH